MNIQKYKKSVLHNLMIVVSYKWTQNAVDKLSLVIGYNNGISVKEKQTKNKAELRVNDGFPCHRFH